MINLKRMIEEYKDLEEAIHDYFNYREDWVTIPIDDCTEMYWALSLTPALATNLEVAHEALDMMRFPVTIKSAFTVLLPEVAHNALEFDDICEKHIALSPTSEIMITPQMGEEVIFYPEKQNVEDAVNGEDHLEWYQEAVYSQRFLPHWIYYAPDYTMIACDTKTDGNKYLRIFDNKKRVIKE